MAARDFSEVKDHYLYLRLRSDPEVGNCVECLDQSDLHIRTQKAEEQFVIHPLWRRRIATA